MFACPTCSTDGIQVIHGRAPCPELFLPDSSIAELDAPASPMPSQEHDQQAAWSRWCCDMVRRCVPDPNPFPRFHLFRSPRRSKS